jgi:ATP-binding cassette, subfamily B, bacterial
VGKLPIKPVKTSLYWLWRHIRAQRGKLALIILFITLETTCLLVLPRLIAAFVNDAVGPRNLNWLLTLAASYLGLTLLSQLVRAFKTYMATDLGMRSTNALRSDALQHVLSLDMSWHNQTTPGTLIERIDGDATKLNTLLSSLLPELFNNVILLIGTLIGLALIEWRAAAIAFSIIPMVWFTLWALNKFAVRWYAAERETSAQLFGFVEERLAGTEDVRANGAVGYVMRRFLQLSNTWGHAYVRSRMFSSMNWTAPMFFHFGLLISLLAFGVWLFTTQPGVITIGAMIAMYRYADLLAHPLNHMGRQIGEVAEATASVKRLGELFALTPTIQGSGQHTLPAGPLRLAFNSVHFSYPDSDQSDPDARVLADVSFRLGERRVLGLLGRTGSGKTTLTRLIARLYEPARGSITLNDVRLGDIAIADLRDRVALVTQDVQLFSATVRNNLTLYDDSIDEVAIWSALEQVDMADWARALPRGLDTELASAGSDLSAGQAQLLAFARACLRVPGLVILDEASSRLDPATEQRLEHAVDALLRERTAIIIAHRLKTVERADDILILEDGRIVEYGPREALAIDPNSRYYALLNYGAEEVLA